MESEGNGRRKASAGRAIGKQVGRRAARQHGLLPPKVGAFALTLAMLRCGAGYSRLKHASQPERQRERTGTPTKADRQRREPPGAHVQRLQRKGVIICVSKFESKCIAST